MLTSALVRNAPGILSDAKLENTSLKIASLALLLVALACAWVPHTQSAWWSMGLSWWGWSQLQVSFTPDFISGMLALLIISPLYARGIVSYAYHSIANIVFFVVNLALTATFIQIALGKGAGFGTFPALAAIMCAIALSWLGMRAAAGMAWLGLLAFSIVSALISNYSWGLPGFGFVASGFCGVLLQTPLKPSGMVFEIINEYSPRRSERAVLDRLMLDPQPVIPPAR